MNSRRFRMLFFAVFSFVMLSLIVLMFRFVYEKTLIKNILINGENFDATVDLAVVGLMENEFVSQSIFALLDPAQINKNKLKNSLWQIEKINKKFPNDLEIKVWRRPLIASLQTTDKTFLVTNSGELVAGDGIEWQAFNLPTIKFPELEINNQQLLQFLARLIALVVERKMFPKEIQVISKEEIIWVDSTNLQLVFDQSLDPNTLVSQINVIQSSYTQATGPLQKYTQQRIAIDLRFRYPVIKQVTE